MDETEADSGMKTGKRKKLAGSRTDELIDILSTWWRRYRQRRLLLSLDNRALKDMGISRADAEAEATKGFWRE